ncbi:oxidoreductase [Sphaerisporangium rufum]|uniref:Oxidoreductase n=1 Tax=Sphaerisporangium rufum TaxID=1381558 RepID=A0A919R2K3_9ACTN|nr:FAD-dependent monooxygenase [Sphaerisporangium rufum]GII77888.1 oxidoreductase [Sphaerisporangium rufum]
MQNRTVLISGAGIAGPTLAYWLARHGFRPTVIERAAGLRSSGNPVDVRGGAVTVVEQMGAMPRVRAAATKVAALSFVTATGRRAGRIAMGALREGDGEVEIPRDDLAAILYETSRDHAEYVFGDSIATLEQDDAGVDVTFERAAPRRFDLVIGADGLHSTVRRLVFGPEADFVRHRGVYVATVPIDGLAGDEREVVMYNTPGRAVAVHPGRDGHGGAAFMFRAPAVPGFDHRDLAQHRRLLAAAYAGAGWRVPEILARALESDELYFDSVSQVRVSPWSRGRVALLGDAASCVSLFGDGSTLAVTGAFALAGALAEAPADHRAAFGRYEAGHRVLTDAKQRAMPMTAALLIPASRPGIAVRNLATRLVPVLGAAARLRRPRTTVPAARGHGAAPR